MLGGINNKGFPLTDEEVAEASLPDSVELDDPVQSLRGIQLNRSRVTHPCQHAPS